MLESALPAVNSLTDTRNAAGIAGCSDAARCKLREPDESRQAVMGARSSAAGSLRVQPRRAGGRRHAATERALAATAAAAAA